MLGYVLALRDKPHEGITCIEVVISLNPQHPSWYAGDLAIARQIAGHHAQAIACIQRLPATGAWKETRLAACHAVQGDAAGAARHLDRAESVSPGWNAQSVVDSRAELEHDADRNHLQREVAVTIELRRQWRDRGSPN